LPSSPYEPAENLIAVPLFLAKGLTDTWMSEFRTRLSTAGFSNVRFDPLDSPFRFLVGDRTFECSPVIATFLSPKIARLQSIDATTSLYTVSAVDDAAHFDAFLSLGSGQELILNDSSAPFYAALCHEL
jgi:hypothetical protein